MTATVGPRRCTAAVYIRVSTEDQARRGYSLADQRAACLARAVALGARHVEVFADGGVSGSLLERPGLNALRAGLREGRFGLVVCLEPDRLARNLAHQLLLTEEIERAGARLEFVGFEWQRTPEGELFFALRGAIAQYEREKIRERTSRGRRQKARQGRMPAAFEPYGYRYDPSSSTLTPVEAEAAIVRAAFRWVVEEGLGPSAVARRLDALGVPTRRGAPGWHRGVVARLLRNPVYAGTFYANRYDAAGAFLNRHRAPWERRPVRLRPVEEWIPVPVPAIVEPAVWRAAQARLDVIGRRPTSRSTYLLSGLSVCAVCRRRLVGSVRHDWGR
ncbi:MAG: recombinase family protein, partial [Clostridia bacterium]|nr:recombinase family protein [Clostridia bacterium]